MASYDNPRQGTKSGDKVATKSGSFFQPEISPQTSLTRDQKRLNIRLYWANSEDVEWVRNGFAARKIGFDWLRF